LTALRSTSLDSDAELEPELSQAYRLKEWLINECNHIHKQWDVSTVDEKSLVEALDSMAGEKIPDWLPTQIRFEAQDGEMVMKLDYQDNSGINQRLVTLGDQESIRTPVAQPLLEQHISVSPFLNCHILSFLSLVCWVSGVAIPMPEEALGYIYLDPVPGLWTST